MLDGCFGCAPDATENESGSMKGRRCSTTVARATPWSAVSGLDDPSLDVGSIEREPGRAKTAVTSTIGRPISRNAAPWFSDSALLVP